MKLLFVADPLDTFKTYKDSTFAMMREAASRGHELWACEPQQLVWQRGSLVQARVPLSMLEASSDLGASRGQTLRRVVLPLALPGIIAGSIFTFSLTLGDYIIPQIVGTSARFIGLAVYQLQGTAGNIPLAAAFAVVPIVIMLIYLTLAKRAGAFDAI